MLNIWVNTFLVLFQTFVYSNAAGTKGASGNPWNQGPPHQNWPQDKGPIGGWDDEVSNPQGRFPDDEGSMWKLEDSIPGVPGQSYPNFKKLPDTTFDCRKQMGPGYYGDTETQCQVFHICQADGRHNSFLCPVGTIFNQQTFICDWWFNVNCMDTSVHYTRNGNLYRSPYIGIDGMKVSSYRGGQENGGNAQQPAVGIPTSDPGSKGGTWPSQPQDQPGGNWPSRPHDQPGGNWPSRPQDQPGGNSRRTNQRGNQKGDGRPANRRRNGGGQSMQPNKGSNDGHGRQDAGNFQRGQKGSRRGNQQQQGVRSNQKGGNFRRAANFNDQGWNQRGGMQNIQGQMTNQQKGTKGGSVNQRHPNAQNGFPSQKGGNTGRSDARRSNTNRGMNNNKGFDTNTWSIRAQNFRSSSQDRKGSGSDVWQNNNYEDEPSSENNASFQGSWSSQNGDFRNQNVAYTANQGQTNSWNSDTENFSQWNDNSERSGYEQGQWSKSEENDYDYS